MNYKINMSKILVRVFSVFVCVLPILQYYKVSFLPFNIATMGLIFFGVFFAIERLSLGGTIILNNSPVKKSVCLYLLFIVVNLIITTIYYKYSSNWNNYDELFRMILLVTVFMVGTSYFDLSEAMRFFGKLMILNSFLIACQNILYYVLRRCVLLVIPSLVTEHGYLLFRGRFAGIYMEPAHFAQCALLVLAYYIFQDASDVSKSFRKTIIICISIGIIISGSGQGYILLLILFSMWLVTYLNKDGITKEKVFLGLMVPIVVIFVLFLLMQIPFVARAANRFTDLEIGFGGTALRGRTWTNEIFKRLPIKQKWIGIGFGHLKDLTRGYSNSLNTHLIQCGYFSILFIANILIALARNGMEFARKFVLLFSIMIYFSEAFNPMWLTFFLFFLYQEPKKTRGKKYV